MVLGQVCGWSATSVCGPARGVPHESTPAELSPLNYALTLSALLELLSVRLVAVELSTFRISS